MSTGSISRRSLVLGAAGIVAGQSSRAQDFHRASASSGRFEIDRFIDDVTRAAKESESQLAVEELLRRTLAEPQQILAGVGAPLEAGIHTIHRSDEVTILNVVWAPLMVLLPHNHNMWASIGIYTGREDNILWQKRGRSVVASNAVALSEGQVLGLPSDAIHSVTNPIGRLTGAIHIYGGDFFAPGRSEWDAESLQERPWDLEAARREFKKAVERFRSVP